MSQATNRLSWRTVLTCCDSFKGTLTACDAGLAIERAMRRAESQHAVSSPTSVVHCPMSDGGAGLLESLFFQPPPDAQGNAPTPPFARVRCPSHLITGPLGTPLNETEHEVYFACDLARRTIVVEMAAASGLPMVPEAMKDPRRTTSYGVGQLIRYGMEYVARQTGDPNCGVTVYLGIGGSATNDGGLGAIQALGVELLVAPDTDTKDSNDGDSQRVTTHEGLRPLQRPFTGGDLHRLRGIRFPPAARRMFLRPGQAEGSGVYCKEIRLICDVASPLLGPHGATAIFGPQKCSATWKSAKREAVLQSLERGMTRAARAVVDSTKDDPLFSHSHSHSHSHSTPDVRRWEALCCTPGGGGAGGMSGFFRDVLRAVWMPGADAVASLLGFHDKLRQTDCIVTGEGSFDEQTIRYNKTIGRLLQLVVAENLKRVRYEKSGRTNPSAGIINGVRDVIVICGRTSYKDSATVRRVLLSHMMEQQRQQGGAHQALCNATDAELDAAAPKIHLLSLTPRHFEVREALGRAGYCVEELLTRYFAGEKGLEPHTSHL